MADFDWLTEDEDILSAESGEFRPQLKRPPWLYPLLILIIIAMSAAALYALVVRRGKLAEEAIREEVQRTHELVIEAAESRDVELFTTFLSGADVGWLNVQKEAVRRGRFDESSWLNVYLDEERPYRLDEITLSSDFNEAAVIYTRWYEYPERVGVLVPLQHTAIYRPGDGRWLLAPPKESPRDNIGIFQEGNLTIFYPRRDENYVLRIADNFIAGFPEICNSQPTGSCPENWHLRLEFTDDPDTLINPTASEGSITALSLRLPTPSLIGLPLDVTGYNFLYESYNRVLQRRITSIVAGSMAEQPSED